MKNIFFSFILVLFPLSVFAQDYDWAGVNTHCYEFLPEYDTPAPKGYKPFYLSHYGRHGARTGIKVGAAYDNVISVLKTAADMKILTPSGDSLLNEAVLVDACHNGMEGRLTRVGEAEHQELARRIYSRYTPVFRDGCKYVRVESSTVPRCLVSMNAFTTALSSIQGDLEYTFDTGEKVFAYINSSCSKTVSKIVKQRIDSLTAATVTGNLPFFKRIFTDVEKGLELVQDQDAFLKDVWTVAREGKASGVDEDIYGFLPGDVIRKWWDAELRSIYMRQCNSLEFGDERMGLTVPLVSVIMRQAQEAVLGGKVAADLKFGHDYPLLALASYFGLEGVGDRLSFEDIPQKWSDPMMIPFASNLQMVFYRNARGNVLVKFVYNGRERRLHGLEPVAGDDGSETPYYRWNDVREKFTPSGDILLPEWTDLERGAQYANVSGEIYGVPQTVSILRYPAGAFVTDIADDPGLYPAKNPEYPQAEDPMRPSTVTSGFSSRYGAYAAINGSYFNVRTLYPVTFVRDGKRVEGQTTTKETARVDGFVATDGKDILIALSDTASYIRNAKGMKDILAAGPVLMLDGKVRTGWPYKPFYTLSHPRTVIGKDASGMIYFI
ncbi:MAG: histidine-type phosphatase, partial [Candidatus Cryptobacteroides sp.]